MKQYKYLVTAIKPNPDIERPLNMLGDKGWQLIAIQGGKFIFMKRKEDEK